MFCVSPSVSSEDMFHFVPNTLLTAEPKLRYVTCQGFGLIYKPCHSAEKYLEAKELKLGVEWI